MEIVTLSAETWTGYPIEFRYTSNAYYDLHLEDGETEFGARFTRVETAPFEKRFTDRLFEPYCEEPEALGVLDGGTLVAVIETCSEAWNNRLRVSEMWVDAAHRREGWGSKLMALAKARALRDGRRAVVLETQSCNAPAIAFYRKQGFTFLGFDAQAYSDDDASKREVRLEMSWCAR